jgi:hypothetical protein
MEIKGAEASAKPDAISDCFGSSADISALAADVRFTPESCRDRRSAGM